jgi:hypothetical protein
MEAFAAVGRHVHVQGEAVAVVLHGEAAVGGLRHGGERLVVGEFGEAGLVGGGQVEGLVAQGEFQSAEELGVGAIDQGLGHAARGPLDAGAELFQEGAAPVFTVIGGGGRGRRRLRYHGCGLAVG